MLKSHIATTNLSVRRESVMDCGSPKPCGGPSGSWNVSTVFQSELRHRVVFEIGADRSAMKRAEARAPGRGRNAGFPTGARADWKVGVAGRRSLVTKSEL